MPDFSKKPNFGFGSQPSWAKPAPIPSAPVAPTAPAKPPAVTIDKDVLLAPPRFVTAAPPPSRRIVPTAEPVPGFKPSVDMLIAPVRNYLRAMAPTAMPNSLRDPDAWEAKAKENKAELERELILIGLKDAIDWTE